jgi:hypothetical protein
MSRFDTLYDHARRVQHARYRAIQYNVPAYVDILDAVIANGVQNIEQSQVDSLRAIEDDLIMRENNARGIT